MRAYWVHRFWGRRRTFPKIKGGYLKQLPIPVAEDARVADMAGRAADLAQAMADAVDERRHEQSVARASCLREGSGRRVADLFGLTASQLGDLDHFVTEAVRQS